MGMYVISDIHGCYDELQSMLKKIGFSGKDRLYLAGDYVDRGNQSLEMLDWLSMHAENIYPVKGNHDAEFAYYVSIMQVVDEVEELDTDQDSDTAVKSLLENTKYYLKKNHPHSGRYFDYYGTLTDLAVRRKVTFKDLCRWADLLGKLPYYYRFDMNGRDCVVVHAGFCEPSYMAEESDLERFCIYAREDAIRIGGVRNGMIIAGHTPTILENFPFYNDGRVFRYYDEDKNCIYYDIDCGCVYREIYPNGTLSCIRLEDEEIFYL